MQTHQVEVRGEACLKSCPVLFERDGNDDAPQITPPHTPPSAATSSSPPRKSIRIESGTKRTYEGMQSRQNGAGKSGMPRKKFKFTVQEVSGMSSTSGSHLPLAAGKVSVRVCTGRLIDDRIAGDVAAYPGDEIPNSGVLEIAQMEAVLESADNATPASQTANPALVLPPTDSSADPTTSEAATFSSSDTSSNETAPQDDTSLIEASSADYHEMTAVSSPPDEHTIVERPVLDESGSSLESVFMSLKAQNTDRISNSMVSDKYSELTNTESMTFVRIISGIGVNCVSSNLASLASMLDIEKRRLQEHERERLSQMKEGRKHMSLYSVSRTKKEEEYREEEERLSGETEMAIACLTMREIADRDLKHILSVPTELTGDFTEKSEFNELIREINEENASKVAKRERAAVKETYYWPII